MLLVEPTAGAVAVEATADAVAVFFSGESVIVEELSLEDDAEMGEKNVVV